MLPGSEAPVAPTHWSFGQLAALVGAPAAYLRQLPAPLAGINLQYGLTTHRAEQVKTLETDDGRVELRAVTGPDYGRIYDHELVEAVQRIAGDGVGDTRWKVPGVLDWSTGVYNPRVDVTRDTTTLYASDRDVFLFLVDDLNPIEAGRLPDGSPDLYFRGFYCWNSEVGAKTLGMASFYLRAVCQNRNLWGVEDFEEITIRHSKYAASRFATEAAPALTRFANSSPRAVRQRHQGGADADRRPHRRGPDRVPAQARLLEGGDDQDHRDGARRGRAASRKACSTSSRASPRSHATRRTRTRGWTWRRRPRSSSTAPSERLCASRPNSASLLNLRLRLALQRKRRAAAFVTGSRRSRERLSAGPSRRRSMPKSVAKIALSTFARHPVQPAGPEPGQCPPHQGGRLDRGARRRHRPPHAAAEPHGPADPRRQGRRDRHVRGPGRRPPLPGARTPGQAEAARPHRPDPLRGANGRPRRGRQPRREHPARAAASARPVPCVPYAAREGQVRGGDRGGVLRLGRGGAPAAASRRGVADSCSTSMPRTA